MALSCQNCGAPLPEGLVQCPSCLAFVKRQGLLQRLLAGFKVSLQGRAPTVSGAGAGSSVKIKTTVRQTYKIRDAATGEIKEYRSLDEVPAQYRETLRQALGKVDTVKSGSITFTGPDGVAHTYRSMDEVPADIRSLIERAKKGRDANS